MKCREDRAEREHARLSVNQSQQDCAESRLHLCVLVQPVQHDLGDGVSFELDHHTQSIAVGLVPHVPDVRELLVPHQVGDLLHQTGFVDHERDLGDDDPVHAAIHLLDGGFGTHHDAAASRTVGVLRCLVCRRCRHRWGSPGRSRVARAPPEGAPGRRSEPSWPIRSHAGCGAVCWSPSPPRCQSSH